MEGKVLGVGTPIIDRTWLLHHDVPDKGSTKGVTASELAAYKQELGPPYQECVGGSASNTIQGLAQLGQPCAFWGRIGKDVNADLYESLSVHKDIEWHFQRTLSPTIEVACLITPDGERTMRYLSEGFQDLKPQDFKVSLLDNIKHVHMEGYLFLNPPLMEAIASLAKERGIPLSLDLGSTEMVYSHKEALLHFISNYVNTLFGNAAEVFALTDRQPSSGCRHLTERCSTVVVFEGDRGAHIGQEGTYYHQPAFPNTPVDTTGAGDLFASGFLYGQLTKKTIAQSAHIGALIASEVVKTFGAQISLVTWTDIHHRIAS